MTTNVLQSIDVSVPVSRIDEEDEFYKNQADKFAAIAKSILCGESCRSF